jgi:long-chain fatty acid transport protein
MLMGRFALCSLLVPCSIWSLADAADGTRLTGIGTAQTATAGGGIASPQDSTWIALDPASLVAIPERMDVDVSYLYPDITLTPEGPLGNAAAGTIHDHENILVPALSYARPLAGGVLGIGLYADGGQVIGLPQSRSSIGQGADFDRSAESYLFTLAAGYGRELYDGWSLGLTAMADYGEFRSDFITNAGSETAGINGIDHAAGGGFAVGIYKHWDQLSVAGCYTSRQWLQPYRHYSDLLVVPLDEPQMFQVGIAWRPLTWLEPLLDYHFIGWHSVPAYGDAKNGFGWRNQSIVIVGVNAYLDHGLTLHGGFSYGDSPITSAVVFRNGLSPLISHEQASLGVCYNSTANVHYSLTYLHSFRSSITDNGEDVGGAGAGTSISLSVDELSAGVGYSF